MKRFENILVTIACLLLACMRGHARKNKKGERYLIIQPTGNIGDMVCLTPVMAAIKRADPQAFIAVMGSARNEELLRHDQDIDRYIVHPASMLPLMRIIRHERFDTGIIVDLSTRAFGTLFLAGVERISCFSMIPQFIGTVPRSYRIVSTMGHQTEYVPGAYVPDQYVKLLEPLGIQGAGARKTLGHSVQSSRKIEAVLAHAGVKKDEKVIALAPGAGADYKCWPAERFGELANRLYERYQYPIIFIGGEKDERAVMDAAKVCGEKTRSLIPGPQDLAELKAILARAELVIGNDSGAAHVAEALGTRTLVIAGATDVKEHFQEDATHTIVRGSLGGRVYQAYVVDDHSIDEDLARRQMESIPVDVVLERAERLLETPHH